MRSLPFFGKGMAFQFRVNPVTGGVTVTEGNTDSTSVALQFLNDRWTIREELNPPSNHIAEALAHILMTRPTEHDTLPEFGSYLFTIIFEPNTAEFQNAAAFYLKHAAERWEKRVSIPDGGVQWFFRGDLVDQGQLPVHVNIQFITQQTQGNLVKPFVTSRQARVQEYPAGDIDASGHDYVSRYHGIGRYERNSIIRNRFPRLKPIPPAYDDEFYTVGTADTWLLISWNLWKDIRYWPYIKRMYVTDCAKAGFSRISQDPTQILTTGTVLRVPSRRRLLELVGAGN